MWSAVANHFLPPACSSVIVISWRILLFISLSYSFPMLLDRVIPLSVLHLPFVPFPLYIRLSSTLYNCGGIVFVFVMWLNMLRYVFLVFMLASMSASLGMLSGPVSFFIALSSSGSVNGSTTVFLVMVPMFFMRLSVMCFSNSL